MYERCMKDVRLYCLSCAGGSVALYKDWKELGVEVCPIELSGHGIRFHESLYRTMEETVDDIFSKIDTSSPYAFFGHSLGSILCYELIIRIQKEQRPLPEHAFFSAANPPEVRPYQDYDSMSSDILIEKLYQMGGMDKSIIEDSALMEIFLPIIRSDLRLLSSYNYERAFPPVGCDISILFGKNDTGTVWHDLRLWYKYTMRSCKFKEFSGGHFYLNDNREALFAYIRSQFKN